MAAVHRQELRALRDPSALTPIRQPSTGERPCGSVETLLAQLEGALASSLQSRFQQALETRAHADENVHAGRRFVASYVELTHFVEAAESILAGHSPSHGEAETATPRHLHD